MAAPQIGLDEPYDAEPVDIWGIGVILFTLLAGSTSTSICRLFDTHLEHALPDTPWDEPSRRSLEYCRYLSGQCFDDDPWNRFGIDVLDG